MGTMFGVQHAGFIIASYAVTIATIGALIAWIAIDHRRQKAALAGLEARGVTRRSARGGEAS
jgi:heme exporter protein D